MHTRSYGLLSVKICAIITYYERGVLPVKDMPAFTTENGAAALTLREIPYTGRAYIRIWDSMTPEALLAECVSFCKMVGATQVFATGHALLEAYPVHARIVVMRCDAGALGDTDAALWPVQQETLQQWKDIYNRKAVKIPGAAWMDDGDCARMLAAGEAYFVHRGDTLLGTGRVLGDTLSWVCSCQPGAGKDVVRALAHACTGDVLTLEVALENTKAVALYEELGFVASAAKETWYCVTGLKREL